MANSRIYLSNAQLHKLLNQFKSNGMLNHILLQQDELPISDSNRDGLVKDFPRGVMVNGERGKPEDTPGSRAANIARLKEIMGEQLYNVMDTAYSQEINALALLVPALAKEHRDIPSDIRIGSQQMSLDTKTNPPVFTLKVKNFCPMGSKNPSNEKIFAGEDDEVEARYEWVNNTFRRAGVWLSSYLANKFIPKRLLEEFRRVHRVRLENSTNVNNLIKGLEEEYKKWQTKCTTYLERAGARSVAAIDQAHLVFLRSSATPNPKEAAAKLEAFEDAQIANKLMIAVRDQVTALREIATSMDDEKIHRTVSKCAVAYDQAYAEIPEKFAKKEASMGTIIAKNAGLFVAMLGVGWMIGATIKYFFIDHRVGFYRDAERVEMLQAFKKNGSRLRFFHDPKSANRNTLPPSGDEKKEHSPPGGLSMHATDN